MLHQTEIWDSIPDGGRPGTNTAAPFFLLPLTINLGSKLFVELAPLSVLVRSVLLSKLPASPQDITKKAYTLTLG